VARSDNGKEGRQPCPPGTSAGQITAAKSGHGRYDRDRLGQAKSGPSRPDRRDRNRLIKGGENRANRAAEKIRKGGCLSFRQTPEFS
jgi:hypothetical protein